MKNLFDLTGKVAVVTGASSGYAEMGADVALLARRVDKLEEVKKEIEKIGRRAICIECDVTKENSVKKAVDEVLSAFDHIDILLNDAGVAVRGGVDTLEEEDWDKSFNTNVKGIYFMCKYVIPGMKERMYGKIVNVSSVNAIVADKNDMFIRHSYNASKAAVMACSYARYNITVNAIGPGLFETGMTENTLFKSEEFLRGYNALNPSSRPGRHGEVNGTILYLSSDASSYIEGQFIAIDGGGSIV